MLQTTLTAEESANLAYLGQLDRNIQKLTTAPKDEEKELYDLTCTSKILRLTFNFDIYYINPFEIMYQPKDIKKIYSVEKIKDSYLVQVCPIASTEQIKSEIEKLIIPF